LNVHVKSIATEAPYQTGRTERHGSILKNIITKIVQSTQAPGLMEVQMALVQALDAKNRPGNSGGFASSQWVLRRFPRLGGLSPPSTIEDL